MSYWITIGTALISCAIAALTGIVLIPFLKKIHFGQTILEIGPKWHKSKQGTPIMGGFMFIISSIIAVIIGYLLYRSRNMVDITEKTASYNAIRLLACILFSVLFSGIGFLDDYIKAVKKQNLGLNPKQKMIFQFILSAAFLAVLYALGDKSTKLDLIFFQLDLGIFYYPIMILFMIYVSNAVNLTDGVDGLCGSVTFVTMLAFSAVCGIMKSYEISIYAIAIAGGCLGFLIWNLHPAKCFMGDTGSMYLGGAFVAIGLTTHKHLLMVLVGLVYILEALSVVIQVTYFKITARQHYKKTGEKGKGKRIFKMSPIHHHFEMCGFSEYKIVIMFSIAAIIVSALGVLTVI
ncbi:phospho-N-acetylmuramoyl-pentapeptide-transferase [Porcipelethomonas ammoniilytica]|uniref:phospho-N-acetylmuramoyl-pentapeptide- transferase n=1 Tax=Porcipelethomonas ammoniilytica TaxID=2981722 RepID=UPI000822DFBC|nr:phospho-N-acetylmuramoyl-pentapeptide-transferase [Porcipelethomonas ammoniilytica]MCU6720195.1 phospho-N-acetylmuramoyl-pentapeptide-transferase [Porcipelethomonas ammoniilytica]MEE0186805.1 phospho-N-acetylmuramoyl-pentapeptide-transferase [Oscillospiraceae bacterium]OLA72100.1 MAG: phospho-N-acetylmuramoyl-pentapeptide-transferase [Ruminococcus sp. 37_24]SCJ04715.1 Phospho-N-acetylmuramoyl-pentapeptide-transferase [uncultured Ruminococcus sp.]